MPKYPLIKTAKVLKSRLGGYVAVYPCPYCKEELTSKEIEIGKPDSCPHCRGVFKVDDSINDQIQQQKQEAQEEKQRRLEQKKQAKEQRRVKRKEQQQSVYDMLNRPLFDSPTVEEPEQQTQQTSPQMSPQHTTCPYCKETIIAEATKCKHCGEYLNDKPETTKEKTAGQKSAEAITAIVGIGCALPFIVIFLFCLGAFNSGPSSSSSSLDDESKVWVAAQNIVERHLKAPGTASYGWQTSNDTVKALGNGEYTVEGYVDAENSFGGEVRTNFTLKLRKSGGGYELIDSSFY